MNWDWNTKHTKYFADKDGAARFKNAICSAESCRLDGRVTLRKTLETRKMGNCIYRDKRHVNGYSVTYKAFSMSDEIGIAALPEYKTAIGGPHTT